MIRRLKLSEIRELTERYQAYARLPEPHRTTALNGLCQYAVPRIPALLDAMVKAHYVQNAVDKAEAVGHDIAIGDLRDMLRRDHFPPRIDPTDEPIFMFGPDIPIVAPTAETERVAELENELARVTEERDRLRIELEAEGELLLTDKLELAECALAQSLEREQLLDHRLEELADIVAGAAPLGWAASQDMDGAQEWEKRAHDALKALPWPSGGLPQGLTVAAIRLVTRGCRKHVDEAKAGSLQQFFKDAPKACPWCDRERIADLEKDIDAAELRVLDEGIRIVLDIDEPHESTDVNIGMGIGICQAAKALHGLQKSIVAGVRLGRSAPSSDHEQAEDGSGQEASELPGGRGSPGDD